MKALTFSFDDGTLQDERLVEILNKHGLKATFNLNSGLLGQEGKLSIGGENIDHTKVKANDVARLYAGHEVAAHTLTHPFLPHLSEEEIVTQVEEDRKELSRLVGYEVVGMAYPCGGENNDKRVADIIKRRTNVLYARTVVSSYSFELQDNLYRFNPTVYHTEWDEMQQLAKKFVDLKTDKTALFYIWGHSFEFDWQKNWDAFDEFCKNISGRSDICYCTNREIFRV